MFVMNLLIINKKSNAEVSYYTQASVANQWAGLSPEMVITVTTKMQVSDPFYNGVVEIQEMYMRIYGFDYKKAGCRKDYFIVEALG